MEYGQYLHNGYKSEQLAFTKLEEDGIFKMQDPVKLSIQVGFSLLPYLVPYFGYYIPPVPPLLPTPTLYINSLFSS